MPPKLSCNEMRMKTTSYQDYPGIICEPDEQHVRTDSIAEVRAFARIQHDQMKQMYEEMDEMKREVHAYKTILKGML
jgi:hypothetical protein